MIQMQNVLWSGLEVKEKFLARPCLHSSCWLWWHFGDISAAHMSGGLECGGKTERIFECVYLLDIFPLLLYLFFHILYVQSCFSSLCQSFSILLVLTSSLLSISSSLSSPLPFTISPFAPFFFIVVCSLSLLSLSPPRQRTVFVCQKLYDRRMWSHTSIIFIRNSSFFFLLHPVPARVPQRPPEKCDTRMRPFKFYRSFSPGPCLPISALDSHL